MKFEGDFIIWFFDVVEGNDFQDIIDDNCFIVFKIIVMEYKYILMNYVFVQLL